MNYMQIKLSKLILDLQLEIYELNFYNRIQSVAHYSPERSDFIHSDTKIDNPTFA